MAEPGGRNQPPAGLPADPPGAPSSAGATAPDPTDPAAPDPTDPAAPDPTDPAPPGPPPPGSAGRVVRTVDLDLRSVAWFLAVAVVVVGIASLARVASQALTLVAVAGFLALALDPLVSAVAGRVGGRRAMAVTVVTAGAFAVTALTLVLVAPPAVDQARRLGEDLDQVVGQLDKLPVIGDDLRDAGTSTAVADWIRALPERFRGADTPVGDALRRVADWILVVSLTVLLCVTLLLDGPRLAQGVRALVPPARRTQADRLGRLTRDTIGRYVAGSLLVAAIAGGATLVAGLVLGVPLAPLVAVWVAVFDLVPQIGGAAGGIPFVLLGLTQGAGTAVACAVFFVLYLQFENHVLSPLVVGRAVQLSPPATMTAAIIGVSAGGVVGALLAVPAVAAAKAVYVELRRPPGAGPAAETA